VASLFYRIFSWDVGFAKLFVGGMPASITENNRRPNPENIL
jgi:hypothetical protein